ncbi:hypothetical protein MTR_7g104390 [Medicago truncatula]|uniref:Uncharacterized protein n=1 Tax=Medicago truncatula TaxID=3880 RepID=G7L622_MEDTR|nr:hypothetical protein MTR_7g104390 [Medicago truncatula]
MNTKITKFTSHTYVPDSCQDSYVKVQEMQRYVISPVQDVVWIHQLLGSTNKLLSAANFTGIALFALLYTEMQFKDKWIACLSLGVQTFRTKSSQQKSKQMSR